MGIMRKTIIGSFIIILMISTGSYALTLKESVDLALKNNPSVRSYQKKSDAANARLGQAVGSFFPTIKAEGTIGRSYSQPSTMQMTVPTTQGSTVQDITFGTDAVADGKSITLSLSQPIFVAALLPGYKIAQKSADLAKQDFNNSILDTSFQAIRTYFGVVLANKMVKLAEESRNMALSHKNLVESMLNAGVSTRADLLRAEVQLANSEVGLTKTQNALELAKDAFNNALGRNLEEPVVLEEESLTGQVANIPTYPTLLSTAWDNRPDWKQFILGKEISEENLRVTQTGYLPTVLLTGQTGNRITEYPSYRTDVNSWTIIGVASWTLFDGLSTQNRINEAAANLSAQKTTEEQVRNGVALEVRDAFLTLKSSLLTIGSTQKAVNSAEESLKLSNLRYSSGVGTNLEVIDAQVSLTQAKYNHLQALFDTEINKAKVNKVVGKEVL